MPDRETKSADKESKEYNLKVAEHVYSEFCRGATFVDYNWYDTVSRNRNYANGTQDVSTYMDAFYGKEEANTVIENFDTANTRLAKRKAYANINFDIQSPMPRVMDSIVNKLSEYVNRVSVDASDKYSGAQRENLKWGTYVDGKYRDEIASLRAILSLPQQEVGYTPTSVEELNLFEAEGGFKLAYEETMERLLKYAFEQSNWEENSIERHIHDLITVGFTATEDYYDKRTGQVKAKYLDAEFVGVQYTKEDAYRNPDYGFFIQMVKLSELYNNGVDEEALMAASKAFSGMYGNPASDDWNKTNKTKMDYSGYDKYTVPVFVVYWKDVDFKTEKQYKNRQGKMRTKDVPNDYKPKEREGVIETRIKTIRKLHWVIGTSCVYDYGKCEFQGRDGLSEPVLPISMVKVTGRPIVSRLIPSLDQYMMGWVKMQHGISMAAMDGYAINMDAISNLSMGGKKMNPREVLRFWRQTGTLFFKPTDVAGNPNAGMMTRPIEQLQGGAGRIIQEAVLLMDVAMQQVERLTGVNPVSMGESPEKGIGKAVTEFSIMGTNDVLKGVVKQANILKSDVARKITLRLQHVIGSDRTAYSAYVDVVGESALELVKTANGGDVKYGIRTHARPTEQDIVELKTMIADELRNGRDGKKTISTADAVRFNQMINSGASLKRVALLLEFSAKKAMEDAEAREMRAQELNAQTAQQAAMFKEEEMRKTKFLEMQASIQTENAKGKVKILETAVNNGQLPWEQALVLLGNQPMQQPQQQQQQQGLTQTQDRVSPMAEDVV